MGKTFIPGKKITTMTPVRIENAPNKLEACTTTAPAYALPSKAAVKNVSLGGRRRLAPLDKDMEAFVKRAIRKWNVVKYDNKTGSSILELCKTIDGYYDQSDHADIERVFNHVWSRLVQESRKQIRKQLRKNRQKAKRLDDQGNTIFEEAVSFKNFNQEAETRENARMNRMRSAVDSGSSKQTDIASASAAAGSKQNYVYSWEKDCAEFDDVMSKHEAKQTAAEEGKKIADKKRSDAAYNAWAKANRKKASAVGNTLLQKRTGNRAMDKAFAVDDNLDW